MQSIALKCTVAIIIVPAAVGLFTKPLHQYASSQKNLAASLWLADGERAGEGVEEGLAGKGATGESDASILLARDRELVENNLAGHGPGNGTNEVIRFSPLLKVGRSYVDLVVSAREPYMPHNLDPNPNGWANRRWKELGQINIKGGKAAELKFSFYLKDTSTPFAMPPYDITFWDIDGRKKNYDAETLSIPTQYLSGYAFFPTTNLTYSADPITQVTTFAANSWGTGCDNPGRFSKIGPKNCTYEKDQPKKSVDPRSYAVVLHMKTGSEFNITYLLDNGGGGNFFFSLSNFADYDLEPEPTPAPTPATGGYVSEFGDPHVSNINRENFDILSVGVFTFLAIPGLPNEEEPALKVHAKVEALGPLCEGRLYVTRLWFAGEWLGELRSLELATKISQDETDEGIDNIMKVKAGNADAVLDVPGFLATGPALPVEVTEFHPDKPRDLNEHVTMVLVKLTLGPAIFKVRHVLQREKSGYSNALWLSASGLQAVDSEIHGLLGKDDHTLAASPPQECKGVRRQSNCAWCGVHASASLDDDE